MRTQIKQWGNSMAVRIPKAMAESLALGSNAEVELNVTDGALLIKPYRRDESLAELVAAITPDNLHSEVTTGTPHGREIW
ncbi:MAG TPA: AbrB/MazE/SpoVT family DNA-binding domain-containing protein [Candidatus Saccharimonadia bacterium]|nr:AbrB/MazE/SpoVT family DNA-binding domain-containing protein [Candidatus Saccharimonadia bacterium]